MDLAYCKRFRMEIDLTGRNLGLPQPPAGYAFLPWDGSLLDAFAQAKYLSFRGEMDAEVFPCLSEYEGCRRLMAEIAGRPGFLPGATWLLVYESSQSAKPEYCGTIQGVRDQHGLGAIQNLGVAPRHRRAGLGTCLLLRSLVGFRQAGVRRVYLEVTAKNRGAIRLYQRAGFVALRTVYKTIETPSESSK